MHTRRAALAFITTLAAAGAAQAQPQAPAAHASPLDRPMVPGQIPGPYGDAVTLEHAQRVIAAAIAEARRAGTLMAFAIADPAGDLVAFARMDGVQSASVQTAHDKARCAARFRRPTLYWAQQIALGNINLMTLDGVVAAEGGLPLVDARGRVIGALGISGGTSIQDGDVASAALAAAR